MEPERAWGRGEAHFSRECAERGSSLPGPAERLILQRQTLLHSRGPPPDKGVCFLKSLSETAGGLLRQKGGPRDRDGGRPAGGSYPQAMIAVCTALPPDGGHLIGARLSHIVTAASAACEPSYSSSPLVPEAASGVRAVVRAASQVASLSVSHYHGPIN